MSKKFLTKVVLATVLASGINLLQTPNFDTGNVQISVAYAESKNFAAKEAAMTDVEIIEAQAKEASRLRAIEAVKEKIASYVRNFSGAKGKLNEDDIAAIAEKFEEVGEAKYKKLFYNAVDEEGKELGKVGIMYEATVTAKFNSKKITEYIKLTEQEKERRIRQAREAREHFEELDREYEELRKNARTKTPEQLQSDIKIFDDKISDLEKRREKNKSDSKKSKNTAPKNKTVANKPMKFSNPVEIGNVAQLMGGGYILENAKSNIGTKTEHKSYDGRDGYKNGIATFGTKGNFIYFHYNYERGKTTVNLGGKDLKNTFKIQNAIAFDFRQIKTNNDVTFYIIRVTHCTVTDYYISNFVLLGEKNNGSFVKYFDTWSILKKYFGKAFPDGIYCKTFHLIQPDTITVEYRRCPYNDWDNATEIGEFRFKWDDAAQWFSVEQIKY